MKNFLLVEDADGGVAVLHRSWAVESTPVDKDKWLRFYWPKHATKYIKKGTSPPTEGKLWPVYLGFVLKLFSTYSEARAANKALSGESDVEALNDKLGKRRRKPNSRYSCPSPKRIHPEDEVGPAAAEGDFTELSNVDALSGESDVEGLNDKLGKLRRKPNSRFSCPSPKRIHPEGDVGPAAAEEDFIVLSNVDMVAHIEPEAEPTVVARPQTIPIELAGKSTEELLAILVTEQREGIRALQQQQENQFWELREEIRRSIRPLRTVSMDLLHLDEHSIVA